MLARIDPVQAESDAASAQAQVHALESDERAAGEQVRAAQSDLDADLARARDARQQLDRKGELNRQGLVTRQDFESARAVSDAADAEVASARAAVDRARQTLAGATRRVTQAKAQQIRANDIVSKTSVVSPIDGIVTRLHVREGEMVVVGIQNQPGTTLMTVSDLGEINAEVKVAEADVLRLALGQPAVVTLEALPGRAFPGTVVEIGASALARHRHRRRRARVQGGGAARPPRSGPAPRPHVRRRDRHQRADRTSSPCRSRASCSAPGASGAADRSGVFVVKDGRAVFTPVTAGRHRRPRHRSLRRRRRHADRRRTVSGAARAEGRHRWSARTGQG